MDSKELLTHEFKSLGFYISNHPLNEYEEIFNHLNIISFKNFYQNNLTEVISSWNDNVYTREKSSKGMPYAIIKFSDKEGEFELFLFSEILVANRDKLKESESFILTLQKDKTLDEGVKKELTLEKILSLDQVINKPYSQVTIELKKILILMKLRIYYQVMVKQR